METDDKELDVYVHLHMQLSEPNEKNSIYSVLEVFCQGRITGIIIITINLKAITYGISGKISV